MGNLRSGTVSWVDLSTPDIDGARRFYADLLGWELDVQLTPMGEYTIASVGGREVTGMMAHPTEITGAPAAWTVFLVVDDMKATLARLTGAGGAEQRADR